MKLDLLERIFQDLETLFYLDEAKEKAKLFYKCATDIHANLQSDYWIQIGKEWDLNISSFEGKTYLTLYPTYKINGCFETDTKKMYPIDI